MAREMSKLKRKSHLAFLEMSIIGFLKAKEVMDTLPF